MSLAFKTGEYGSLSSRGTAGPRIGVIAFYLPTPKPPQCPLYDSHLNLSCFLWLVLASKSGSPASAGLSVLANVSCFLKSHLALRSQEGQSGVLSLAPSGFETDLFKIKLAPEKHRNSCLFS